MIEPSLALLQPTCEEPEAEAVSKGGLAITIASPVEAEQPLASKTMIEYDPEPKPENIFELCTAPPFNEYVYDSVPPTAVTVIEPSLALLQLTCDEPLALAVSKGGLDITIGAETETEQPLESYTIILYVPAIKP